MNKQATIGITAKHGSQEWIEENTHEYIDVVCSYGLTPVVLSPDTPAVYSDGSLFISDHMAFIPDQLGRMPSEILDHLDGLILAGGGDVDPKYFDAELDGANEAGIDLKRDELELTLARDAMAADMPLLGVCRGCQVLNVAAGGGMVQDFPGHRSSNEHKVYHDVEVKAGSRFHQIVGSERFQTNTYHHQGMDLATMAPLFDVVAMAAAPDEWLVEAYESPQHNWVVAVQWHPERLFELGDEHRRIWDAFVEAVRNGQF